MSVTIKGQVVLEYLEKYSEEKIGRFMPSLTLARLIYNENMVVFKSIEDARGVIRMYRGQLGKENRNKNIENKYYTKKGSPGNFIPPQSEEVSFDEYTLPYRNIGVISDIHVPYHNEVALKAAMDYLGKQNLDCLLINGDLIDCYQASRYVKDPRMRTLKFEIDTTNELLDMIQDCLPSTKLIFKLGNHDERIETLLFTKAPELLGFPEFEYEQLLHAKERGMMIVKDQRIIKAGKLSILHGHELGMNGSSVNPARGAFMKTKQSCLVGHSHVTSEHTETRLDGDIITTWSTGCLCELRPRYARVNRWSHGFAHVTVEGNGDYRVKNLRIWKGKVL